MKDIDFNNDEFLDAMESDESSGQNIPESSHSRFVDSDRFERCGRWLQSMPRDDVVALRHTPEYEEFLKAFDRLGEAHRTIIIMNTLDTQNVSTTLVFNASFLQKSAMDDIVLRIFEYLDSYSLIKTSLSCSRFRDLANQSATGRTIDVGEMRQLDHPLQLLRAKEQIDGVGENAVANRPVPVPMLCLSRRIIVTGCGDADYNGIYHCTGSNGNGFVFTKPRSSGTRVSANARQSSQPRQDPNNWDEPDRGSGALLRCIIAKKFSQENLLWYMSKEIEIATQDSATGLPVSKVSQVYCFWAKLMVAEDASSDICQYPSQSSILGRNDNPGWQPLTLTEMDSNPPVLELLDGGDGHDTFLLPLLSIF